MDGPQQIRYRRWDSSKFGSVNEGLDLWEGVILTYFLRGNTNVFLFKCMLL